MESFILIILVIMPGVWSGAWRVTYGDQCALKGTSEVIKCKFDYPFGHIVTSVIWFKHVNISGQMTRVPLSQLPSPQNYHYVGNYWHDCSLKVQDVQLFDEGDYFFRFETTLDRWSSKTPAHLFVKELSSVVEPSTVTEGDSVSVTCVSGCGSPPNIIWFRDGLRGPHAAFQATREHAGSYHCAVLGRETATSASVALHVQYAPSDVRLSVSPSVRKGSSVTFTCSSDANPPVTPSGYSLHKDGRLISSGQNHTISDVQPSHSGPYYCQAWNNISIHLISSDPALLDVQYPPENISIALEPPHVVEGSSVNVSCSSAANPAADYTWYSSTGSRSSSMLLLGSGQVLSVHSVQVSHTGLYLCQATNPLGESNSTQVLLKVEEKGRGSHSIRVAAVIGVSACMTLTFALLFWLKKRNSAERDQKLSSSAPEDPSSVYVNAHVLQSASSSLADAAQHTAQSQRSSPHSAQEAPTWCEDEVIYTTVIFIPKNPHPPPHTHNTSADLNSTP